MSLQQIVLKPWGRERILVANDKYAFKILEVDAGHRLSLQYHERKTETMYCLYGYGKLFISADGFDREISMIPGQYITIMPEQVHRLEAGEHSPVIVLEVSSPELEDIVRLEDDYKRDADQTKFIDPFDAH